MVLSEMFHRRLQLGSVSSLHFEEEENELCKARRERKRASDAGGRGQGLNKDGQDENCGLPLHLHEMLTDRLMEQVRSEIALESMNSNRVCPSGRVPSSLPSRGRRRRCRCLRSEPSPVYRERRRAPRATPLRGRAVRREGGQHHGQPGWGQRRRGRRHVVDQQRGQRRRRSGHGDHLQPDPRARGGGAIGRRALLHQELDRTPDGEE